MVSGPACGNVSEKGRVNVKGIEKAANIGISISNTAAQHAAVQLAQYGHDIGIRVEDKDTERFRSPS